MSRRRLNAIRSLRKQKNPPMRQADLARLVGSTQSDISAYETGRVVPTLEKAVAIANALGHPLEHVFYGIVELSLDKIGARLKGGESNG